MSATFQLAIHLFLQLSVILIVCRVCGRLLRFVGQTQVVGEMVAGVLLGPSLFGFIAPSAQQILFPTRLTTMVAGVAHTTVHPSMLILYALSQVGLVLYMFAVGMELDLSTLTKHSKAALSVSLSGVLLPCILGGALGVFLVNDRRLFTDKMVGWQAGLFLASAMSITAFPVLARILFEAGITKTRMGTLCIGAAAFGDAYAWCLLACVIAAIKSSYAIALMAIGGGILYTLAMLKVGKPLLKRLEKAVEREGKVSTETLSIVLMVLMLAAWLTDYLGIYSVFGAFIVGIAVPRGKLTEGIQRMIGPITVSLFLPIYFIYSGLSTRMNMLLNPSLAGVSILVILIAFLSKGGGCFLASLGSGMNWRDSIAVGALMNARGLMELILVNIALEKGLIQPGLFTILVLMAIVTTLVASPLFKFLYTKHPLPE